ncbi:MAG: hypothetical protein HY738_12880 [Bacteroidia bacterium]|nr:hypothetical protein [Bacteroidia bacterium]
MKAIFLLILSAIISGCNNNTTLSTMSQNFINAESCLTRDDFNLVKKYVLENGEQIKLNETGLIIDKNTLSIQLLLGNRLIELIDYQNYNHIIVIDKNNEEKIPVYFVSNENIPCEISAYYSVFDTEDNIRIRKNDWCKIVTEIKKVKEKSSALIDRETALKIAEKDAQSAYRDLSIYDIKIELKDEKWYVDYELSNKQMVGGGPHYIISARTGEILSYRYEQ